MQIKMEHPVFILFLWKKNLGRLLKIKQNGKCCVWYFIEDQNNNNHDCLKKGEVNITSPKIKIT